MMILRSINWTAEATEVIRYFHHSFNINFSAGIQCNLKYLTKDVKVLVLMFIGPRHLGTDLWVPVSVGL